MSKFKIIAGSVKGDKHKYANSQDGVTAGTVTINGKTIRWGVVLDGCSSGLRSEAGVLDALDFIEREMPVLLESVSLHQVPDQLIMYKLVEYIEMAAVNKILGRSEALRFIQGEFTIDQHPRREEINQYLRDFYLFTVLLFIQTDEVTIVSSRGDGVIRVNDATSYINQNDKPFYPIYFAIPWTVPAEATASRTMSMQEYATKWVSCVYLGSDSWLRHKELFQALPQFEQKNDRWLQRRLIIWSEDQGDPKLPAEDLYQESVRIAFDDDTTVLALIKEAINV